NGPIVIGMTENVATMNEVTVSTGYQDLRKESATGSYDKINNALFNRRVSTDVLTRLEGITGLYFSKVLGNNSDIFIRGISTIRAGTSPLIVLDNFPYEGSLSNLNPNDVESITVLKDAAAAAIWGARAGNGVIVITTKKGVYWQKTQLTLNTNYTVQQKPDLFRDRDFLNSSDFIDVEKFLFSKGRYDADLNNTTTRPVVSPVVEILAKQRAGQTSQVETDRLINELRGYDIRNDYQKYLNQNAIRKQYALNLSGGSSNINYMLSGGLDNNETTVRGNGNERATFYSSVTIKPLRKLEVQTSLNYTFIRTENNGISSVNPGGGKSELYPYARLADEQGNPLPVEKTYRPAYIDTAGGGLLLDWKYRPLDEQRLNDNTGSLQDILLKARLNYHISPSFKAEVSGQMQRADNVSRTYYSKETFFARDLINRYSQRSGNTIKRNVPLGGILDYGSNKLSAYGLRGQVSYNSSWRQSKINAIAGGEVRESHNASQRGRTFGYDDNILTYGNVDYISLFPLYGNLGNVPIFNNADFGDATNRFVSIYSNAVYSYHNKYILSASIRKDASNLFGLSTNQKWTPLWSSGLAWKVSDESFYGLKFLPLLKARVSYGYTGNIKNDLSSVATVSYTSAGGVINLPYAMVRNPANPDLRWEKTKIFN
ncbi:MAG TPA: TonB-dependent receptor plug domain-containing protein, partial [Segetibacter sp.]